MALINYINLTYMGEKSFSLIELYTVNLNNFI